jgi:leucyl-tRNA synthetase
MENMTDDPAISEDMAFDVHSAIKKVTEDYERMKFNTAIAAMMTLVNTLSSKGSVTKGEASVLLQLLNPVAPHITEELNELLGLGAELFRKPWPAYDPAKLVKATVEIAFQVNGKVRGRVMVPADLTRDSAQGYFSSNEAFQKLIEGKAIRKLIFVPGSLVNVVV